MVKIAIFSYYFNNVDFIEIQHKLLNQYIMDENIEFIIFNDALSNSTNESEINQMCQKFNIKCIRIPQEIHLNNNPSTGYGVSLDWSLHNIGFREYDIVLIIHADVFPIGKVSIMKLLDDYDIYSTVDAPKPGFNHICPVLTILNIKNLPNLNEFSLMNCVIDNIRFDTGGYSYLYLKNNPSIKAYLFDPRQDINNDVCDTRTSMYINIDSRICAKFKIKYGWHSHNFYHYICGSLWDYPRINNILLDNDDKRINAVNIIKQWFRYYKQKRYYNGHNRRRALIRSLII